MTQHFLYMFYELRYMYVHMYQHNLASREMCVHRHVYLMLDTFVHLEIKLFVVTNYCVSLLSEFFLFSTFQNEVLFGAGLRGTPTLQKKYMRLIF